MTGKYLSGFDKGQIQGMRNMGSSIKQIAQTLGRNRKTIGDYLKKANQLPPGEFPKVAPKSGRPRKITERGQLIMKKAFQKSPRKTCKGLKIEQPDLFGHVSRKTLSTYCIRDLNMPSRVARKKPLLTLVHMQKRLAFAKKYRDWKAEDWLNIVWSDESTFQVNHEMPRNVRRPLYKKGMVLGYPYHEKYLKVTVKHQASVMVWACFSGKAGLGSLYFVPKGKIMNAKDYLENILKEKVLLTLEVHGASYFQQDGAPVHTAKICKNWLSDNEVNVLDWPPQSPDLNPIENMWYKMKQQLENYDTRSISKLQEAIKNMWCKDINLDTFIKYASTMPSRIKEVLKNKGGVTHY